MLSTVLQHFERHLGARQGIAALHRGIRVLTFRSPFGDGEVVVATDGARSIDAAAKRAREFVMLCRPEYAEAVAVVLCDLAHYAREHETSLGWFHVLPLGTGIVHGSSLTSLFLTMPWFGTAEFFTAHVDDKSVDVLHAIPTTEHERELFKSSGTDALEQALQDADVDLTDFQRDSAV